MMEVDCKEQLSAANTLIEILNERIFVKDKAIQYALKDKMAAGLYDSTQLIALKNAFAMTPSDAKKIPTQKQAVIEAVAALMKNACPNDDEMGGCVFCDSTPHEGLYVGDDLAEHESDCPWIKLRVEYDALVALSSAGSRARE